MRKSVIGPYYDGELGIDFEEYAAVGLTEVPVDDDGVVRRFHPVFPMLGEQIPSFAIAVALAERGLGPDSTSVRANHLFVGDLAIPLTGQAASDPVDGQRIAAVDVNYPSGGAAFPVVADLAEVSSGAFPPGTFRGKVVFVGVTGSQLIKELRDASINSASARAPELVGGAFRRDMPGVVLQAHNFNAVIEGLWLTPTHWIIRCLLAFILCWLSVSFAERFFDWRGIGALLFLNSLALVGSYALFVSWGVRLPVLAVTSASMAVALATGWMDRVRLRKRWSGYVSPNVMKVIIDSDGAAVQVKCRATVLFADIRGFTSLSEHVEPEDVIDLLNRHYARLVPIISQYGGTIDKFMGDGLLAVFGAPVPFADSTANAVRAAIEMVQAVRTDLTDRHGRTHSVGIGIGMATGDIVAGEVGVRARHDFTVIGEVVNLASRLQGESSGDIVVDQATAEECAVPTDDLGDRNLRGFSSLIRCYRIQVGERSAGTE
jgi:adenylate cyclase